MDKETLLQEIINMNMAMQIEKRRELMRARHRLETIMEIAKMLRDMYHTLAGDHMPVALPTPRKKRRKAVLDGRE